MHITQFKEIEVKGSNMKISLLIFKSHQISVFGIYICEHEHAYV